LRFLLCTGIGAAEGSDRSHVAAIAVCDGHADPPSAFHRACEGKRREPPLPRTAETRLVETIAEAARARMVLTITCQRCSRSRAEWAYNLCQRKPTAATVSLNKTVGGFHCRGCNRGVPIYISARREGEL
jgi:hypothetical protein